MALIIDVSSNNGVIDYQAVRRAGAVGVIVKATEGLTYGSPTYRQQLTAARNAGLYTGSYHFARPDRNGGAQEARHFCDIVGELGKLDLKPALDYETQNTLPRSLQEKWIREFNETVKDRLGRWPFFYSYTSFIRGLNLRVPVGNGLWLADYGPNDGQRHPASAPSPWRKIQLHQYTSVGRVDGFRGDVSYAASVSGLLAFPVQARLAKLKAVV